MSDSPRDSGASVKSPALVDAFLGALLESIGELERDVERLTQRCAYLEQQRLVLRAERDEARADAMAAILDHGLSGPAGRGA